MSKRFAVLGAGRQGTAAAHALARFFAASEVRLVDVDPSLARASASRVNALAGRDVARAVVADAADETAVREAVRGADAVLSAVPYRLNIGAARAAIAAGAHFTDLGGNTDVVRAELRLDDEARRAGVSLVPDSGLAPGLSNALAALVLARRPETREIRAWCGGLPRTPRGLLGYKQVFHIGGLTNEYTGMAVVIRGGEIVEVEAFTELEEVDLPAPVGRAEAFLTSGGTSTCPWTWKGRLDTLEYKTVRWPGHYAMVRPLVALGFLDEEPIDVEGARVSPRALAHRILERHISFPEDGDLVVLRVEGREPSGRALRFDLVDLDDEATGFSAMERTTAYPAAALAHLQAERRVEPGARSLESALEPEEYLRTVLATGLPIVEG